MSNHHVNWQHRSISIYSLVLPTTSLLIHSIATSIACTIASVIATTGIVLVCVLILLGKTLFVTLSGGNDFGLRTSSYNYCNDTSTSSFRTNVIGLVGVLMLCVIIVVGVERNYWHIAIGLPLRSRISVNIGQNNHGRSDTLVGGEERSNSGVLESAYNNISISDGIDDDNGDFIGSSWWVIMEAMNY
mmetsp:Transcript_41365/g.81029  ORF Transcript_41365/g.81029 Transcript_41365/m.81029 type:complete len:188 (+) Transcript_41365:68-631(+)